MWFSSPSIEILVGWSELPGIDPLVLPVGLVGHLILAGRRYQQRRRTLFARRLRRIRIERLSQAVLAGFEGAGQPDDELRRMLHELRLLTWKERDDPLFARKLRQFDDAAREALAAEEGPKREKLAVPLKQRYLALSVRFRR